VSSLDGLRGVAASVVVVHHLILASVAGLAIAYTAGPRSHGIDHLLTYTPLHVIWAGPQFVIVFFVLSGLVLSL
jgi:peptidoglycan/LPS O-acetylase OafA/YrhL